MENKLGVEGAISVSKLTKLQRLNMSDSGIGTEGARVIGSQLPLLVQLRLSYNEITVDGARYLSNLRHLRELVLGREPLMQTSTRSNARDAASSAGSANSMS